MHQNKISYDMNKSYTFQSNMKSARDKFIWSKFYQNPSNMPSAFNWLFFWEAYHEKLWLISTKSS